MEAADLGEALRLFVVGRLFRQEHPCRHLDVSCGRGKPAAADGKRRGFQRVDAVRVIAPGFRHESGCELFPFLGVYFRERGGQFPVKVLLPAAVFEPELPVEGRQLAACRFRHGGGRGVPFRCGVPAGEGRVRGVQLFRGQVSHERPFQLLAVQRLRQIVVKAFLQELLPHARDGVRSEDQEGRVFRVRHFLGGVEGFDAVHAGHPVIEQHRVVAVFRQPVQHGLTVGNGLDLDFGLFQQAGDDQQVDFVVVRHEDARIRRAEGGAVGRFGFGFRQAPREIADEFVAVDFLQQRGRERGADAVGAFKHHVAAHQLCEPLGDGEPQPRAFDATVAHGIQPLKIIENPVLVLRADADARILHDEPQEDRMVLLVLFAGNAKIYAALFRVFGGVGQEVHHDLLDAGHVAEQRVGERLVHLEPEGKPFVFGPGLRHVHGVPQQI